MIYRREIDGLRAVAVLPVIFYHAGFKIFEGGFIGVDVFFVISGYLITSIILSDMNKDKFSIVTFYERRARRILPALFFVLLTCLPFAWFWLIPNNLRDFCQSLTAVSAFSSNILFWRECGYFDTVSELKPLLHTWSLAVEEQYYIIFPLFLMSLWKLRKRWIFGALITLGAISLSLAQWGAYNKPSATFYLLPARVWELAIGALIAFYFLYKREHVEFIKTRKKTSEVLGFIGLLLICYSIFAFNKSTPFPSVYALIPTLGTGLIIIFSTSETIVGRFLGIKPIVGIGLISYSTYLWHQPLFVFARNRSLTEPGTLLLLVLSVVSILLAYISWRFIESPFRNKKVVSRKGVFTFAVIGTLVFASIGLSGHFNKGYEGRVDKSVVKLADPEWGRVVRCLEEPIKDSGEICTVGDQSVTSSIALLGDSHSTRITKRLSELIGNKSIKVYAQSWGVPLLDIGTDDIIGKKRNNRKYFENAYKSIIDNNNINTVILFAEWSNYTKGYRHGDKKVSFYNDSFTKVESLEENINVFRRSLKKSLKVLTDKNKKVIIVESVPEYYVSLPDYVAKVKYFTGKTILPKKYLVDRDKYEDRNKEVMKIFEEYKGYDNINLVDVLNIMCPVNECHYVSDLNELYYTDANHLSYVGSLEISEKIFEKM